MKSDPIQMQQKLIYFKAELDKYKEKVKDYQDNYHYAQLESLKKENEVLVERNQSLTKQVNASKAELEKRLKGHDKELNQSKEKVERLLEEKGTLEHRNAALVQETQTLLREVRTLKEELSDNRKRMSQKQHDMALLQASYINAQKELEEKKKELNAENTAKTNTLEKLNKLEEKRMVEVNNYESQIEKINEEKNRLRSQCDQLNEALEQIRAVQKVEENETSPESIQFLTQLENQVKGLLGHSSEFEKDEDSKVIFMSVLENKLAELTDEIEDIEAKIKIEDAADDNEEK